MLAAQISGFQEARHLRLAVPVHLPGALLLAQRLGRQADSKADSEKAKKAGMSAGVPSDRGWV